MGARKYRALQHRHELTGDYREAQGSLGKAGMEEAQLPQGAPKPEISVSCRSCGCGMWDSTSGPCDLVSLALPSPVSHHQLPSIISHCPEVIDSSHYISIDLSFSLSQFLSVSIINRSTRIISFLYTDCSIHTNFPHLSCTRNP